MIIDVVSFQSRVLFLAPTLRDGEVTRTLLKQGGLDGFACANNKELSDQITHGAGAVLLTEESFSAQSIEALVQALNNQPTWSELPIVILMRGGVQSPTATRVLQALRNVTLLERPAPMRSVLSAVEAAVRGRLRQYQIRDLLESERAARASAEHANRIKDEFVATVSHELRTPLNAMLGWAQVLCDNGSDPAEIAEGLEIIQRNARLQAQLIEDLLDMSRIISGKIRLDLQPVDPGAAIEAAIESVRPAAQSRNVKIVTNFDPPALVMGDSARLQQIFWNLLSNAVKFTPSGGQITVALRRLDPNIEISVTDSGIGIAPQFLPHVFERFRQADGSTTRRHGGLGLGLAIVKQLVELHGGSVSADSAGERLGARFSVTLPIVSARKIKSDSTGNSNADKPPFAFADLTGVKVLVVDDDPDARGLVKRLLGGCKAEVTTAASASEALTLLNDSQPDVLVSDISMPDMDGFELIRRVRNHSDAQKKSLPAAALTAFARSEDRRRVLLAGYQSHIAKPVEPAELIAVIASLTGHGTACAAP